MAVMVILPYKLKIEQVDNYLIVKKMFLEEWQEDRVTEEKINLNGEESKSEFFGSPRVTAASLTANRDTLNMKSKVTMNRGGQTSQMNTTETWSLQNNGKVLSIIQTTITAGSERKITLVYERQ